MPHRHCHSYGLPVPRNSWVILQEITADEMEQSSKAAICFPHLLIPVPKELESLLSFLPTLFLEHLQPELSSPSLTLHLVCFSLLPNTFSFSRNILVDSRHLLTSGQRALQQNILWIRQTQILKFTLRKGKELLQTLSSEKPQIFHFVPSQKSDKAMTAHIQVQLPTDREKIQS